MKSEETPNGMISPAVLLDGAAKASQPQPVMRGKQTMSRAAKGMAKKSKQARRRELRDLNRDLPAFVTVPEFAAFLRVHPRTISRDIDDGLLIANEIRGTLRISRKDAFVYLRKTRRNVGHSQRRRSPRKRIRSTARSGVSEAS